MGSSTQKEKMGAVPAYGYCPICGRPGKQRERRPNGNDHCEDGHIYPSASAHKGNRATTAS